MPQRRPTLRNLLFLTWPVLGMMGGTVNAVDVDYLRDVKPLLEKHCSSCHGGLKQNGGLRLDTAALIRKGGDSGPAIIPADADDSLLVQVLSGDAGFQMPPEGEGSPLGEHQMALIARWINEGAIAPEKEKPQADPATWWSYQPPRRPLLPTVKRQAWVRNEIDAFIAEKHELNGLTPVEFDEPNVLLRRVFLDLVGYPPSTDELERFVSDPSEQSYERVVDELLARPDYGQRWGRHWMDVWRYSDWYGRRPSNEIRYSQRHIWRWRDWIVDSLNSDKGYDRMIVEMLAGDELGTSDTSVLAATGYLGRNWYKFDRNTWLFDTVEHTCRGLMAVTMRCARCHDHKYDPISQQDYYSFRAFFEPHSFRTDPLSGDAATEVDNRTDKVLTDGVSRAYDKDLDVPTYLLLRGDGRHPDTKHPLAPRAPASIGGRPIAIAPIALPPESYLPQLNPAAEAAVRANGQKKIAAAQQSLNEMQAAFSDLKTQFDELATSPARESEHGEPTPFLIDEFDRLDKTRWKVVSGQWSAADGRLTQSRVTSFATLVSLENHPRNFVVRARYRKLQPGMYRSVGFSFDHVDGGRNSQDVYTSRTDGKPLGGVQAFHRIDGRQVYPPAGIRTAEIEVGKWIDLEFRAREHHLTVSLDGKLKLEYELPLERRDGRLALWVHTGAAEFDRLEVLPLIASAADVKAAMESQRHKIVLAERAVALAQAELEFRVQQIAAERARLSGDNQWTRLAIETTRAERLISVIDAEIQVAKAQRQFDISHNTADQTALQDAQAKLKQKTAEFASADDTYTRFKAKYPSTSSGRRLALARWMVDSRHPRTSRVAANYIWLHHFGEALVPTTDNFGLSGQEPSHPELLDWLAVSLSDNNWQMKPLHKLIVMSNTYRMASRSTGSQSQNRLRDPNNKYLWRARSRRMQAEVIRDSMLAVAGKLDKAIGGPDLDEKFGQTSRRRSLYFRTTPDNQMEMLSLFDLASPTECYRRRESVVPQQALAMANSRLTLDLSRELADELSRQTNSPTTFITTAFQCVLCREPTPAEVSECATYLKQATALLAGPKALRAFPSGAETASVKPAKQPSQRARENLVHVLFNHNEFVTIR